MEKVEFDKLVDTYSKHYGDTKENILKYFEESKIELNATFVIDPKDLDEFAMRKVHSLLFKNAQELGTKYDIMFLINGSKNDFGAKKVYDEIKKRFDEGSDEIKRMMYNNGEIDMEGNPLWSSLSTTADFKVYERGTKILLSRENRLIDLEGETRTSAIGIIKDKDGQLVLANVTIYGTQDVNLPLRKELKMFLKGKYNEDSKEYKMSCNSSKVKYEIVNDKELSFNEIESLLTTYFKDNLCDFTESPIGSILEQGKDRALIIVHNFNILNFNFSKDKNKSNILSIVSKTDVEKILTCFIPSNIEAISGFNEGKSYIIGTISLYKEKMSMNVMDVIKEKKEIKKIEVKPVDSPKHDESKKPKWMM